MHQKSNQAQQCFTTVLGLICNASDIKKDLPEWIMGDLENMDQEDYFVSEDESEQRIWVILQTLSTLLLMVCSILAAKCFDYSSFSGKRMIIHSSNGN